MHAVDASAGGLQSKGAKVAASYLVPEGYWTLLEEDHGAKTGKLNELQSWRQVMGIIS
jgi:hypothetical protein